MSLSSEESEKLANFKEITQFEDGDTDKMTTLLRKCDWNLEAALSRFFDNNFDFPEEQQPHNSALHENRSPMAGIRHLEPAANIAPAGGRGARFSGFDDVLMSAHDMLPKLPKANKLVGNWKNSSGVGISAAPGSSGNFGNIFKDSNVSPLFFILLIIPKTILFVLWKLNDFFKFILPDLYGFFKPDLNLFPKSPKYLSPPDSESQSEVTHNDSTMRTFSFTKYVEQLTKDDYTDLPIFEGEFNDAYDISKADLKFLLIILVNDSKVCQIMIKSLFSNNDFKALINDEYLSRTENFMIWGGHVDHLEGFLVGQKYRASRVPYFAMIGNVSTYGTTFPTMSLIKFSCGLSYIEKEDESVDLESLNKVIADKNRRLIRSFKKLAIHYTPQLINQKIDKDERNFERMMKDKQDEEYLRSLEQDRMKKRETDKKKMELIKKKERYLALFKEKFEFVQLMKFYLNEWKELIDSAEPVDLDGTKLKSVCTLSFKFSNGNRIVKKLPRSLTLAQLYLFIQLKLLLEIVPKDFLEKFIYNANFKSKPELGAEHLPSLKQNIKFELISSFPKFKVPLDDQLTIESHKKLLPSCSLLVEFDLDFEDQMKFILDNLDKYESFELSLDDITDENLEKLEEWESSEDIDLA